LFRFVLAARKNSISLSEGSALETVSGGTAPVRRGLRRENSVQHARLLVVIPNPQAADTLRTRLALAGYEVDCVPDGAQALESVQAHAPDMAIVAASESDGSSGETTALWVQSLKAASEGTYLPILVLTHAQAEAEQDWTASGADDALPLGASDALLRLRVGTLLALRRRYQALADSLLEMEASCASAQQAAARYEAAFMQNMEPMLLVGADGQIAEANMCACTLAGCETGTLAGRPLSQLCPPELLWAAHLVAWGAVRAFSDPDASLVTLSGQIIPIEVRSAPVQPAFAPGTDAAQNTDNPPLFVVTLSDRRPEQARLAHAQRAAAAETAAVFSREISSPLFVIASNSELLQNALGQENSGVQAKLGRIAEASRRLAQAAARACEPSPLPAPGE